MIRIKLFVLAFIIFSGSFLLATNYYVDKNASGNNDGSSWQNAWVSFSSINWSLLGPGDVLYISGGTDSTVYNETLTVTSSGSASDRFIITRGVDPGHNGMPVINGQFSLSDGIKIFNEDYVTISGFKISNCTDNLIDIDDCQNLIIENCEMLVTCHGGINIKNSSNCIVRYNYIYTPVFFDAQTDGIYSQENLNNQYDHNYIVINNTETSGHDDGIQMYRDNSTIVSNNYIEQNNNKTSNAQGIYGESPFGLTIYYNNVVNMTYAESNAVAFRRIDGDGDVVIYNNTIFGYKSYSMLYVTETPDPVIKNNVLYSLSSSYAGRLYDWNGNAVNIDNNLIYAPNASNVMYFNQSGVDWSEWQAQGFDQNGVNANPLFVSIEDRDFSPTSLSPLIDQGFDAGPPYNIDINGVSRPQGANWDIGAYEYTDGQDLTPPELDQAVISDSISLTLVFSEQIDEVLAEDISNYLINNGISVISATLLASGTHVALITSPHQPNTNYTIVVENIEDLSGNLISPNDNSADYFFFVPPDDLEKINILTVTASSTADPNYPPEKTIDGLGIYQDPDSRWAAIPMPQYLIFDLGARYEISRTRFSFYGFDFGRIYEFSVFISDDTLTWNNILSNELSVLEEWTINDFPMVETRYVKILFITSNHSTPGQEWAHMWEAEIWGNNTPLPVEFISFTGSSSNGNVILNWITGSEINNYGFEVERKTDGHFIPIGFVEGNGTSVDVNYYSFTDQNVERGNYEYRLRQIDFGGHFEYSDILRITVDSPDEFILEQNYPNPFNPATVINFTLPARTNLQLNVYNILGEKVAELLNGELEAGKHSVKFDANDLPSGVYIYRIESRKYYKSRKMIVMR